MNLECVCTTEGEEGGMGQNEGVGRIGREVGQGSEYFFPFGVKIQLSQEFQHQVCWCFVCSGILVSQFQ